MAWAIAKCAPRTWLITDGDRRVGSVVQHDHRRYTVEVADCRFRCSTIDAARAYAFGVEAGQNTALAAFVTLAPKVSQ